MDAFEFGMFELGLQSMDEEALVLERRRIHKAVKGWDQYPFGKCHVELGRAMIDAIDERLDLIRNKGE